MKTILWAASGMLLATWSAIAAEPTPGRWIDGQISTNGSERDYKLYIPASYQGKPLPLVVMLHGCTQGPDSFAESTRMNQLAESGRFLVLYPSQKISANPTRCWNWFLPANQVRDSGEPAEIVATIVQVTQQHDVDRRRVYVAGLSAGASMSAILAACYPEVFAAAAVHAGTMYKAATTVPDAGKVMVTGKAPEPEQLAEEAWACGGKRKLTVPLMVWQGQGDNIVNRINGEAVVRQFIRLNDWADDGQNNGSAPQAPSTQNGQVTDGHAYSVATYTFKGRPLIEYYRVAEMGHAWSGGLDDLPFSDGKGPNASLLMWNFFKQHSR